MELEKIFDSNCVISALYAYCLKLIGEISVEIALVFLLQVFTTATQNETTATTTITTADTISMHSMP